MNRRLFIRALLTPTILAFAWLAPTALATLTLAPPPCADSVAASAPSSALIPLSHRPFESTRGGSLGKRFGTTIGLASLDSNLERKYRDRAVAFAREQCESCVVHRHADGTYLKMNLANGDLLVVAKSGDISLFTRLPTKPLQFHSPQAAFHAFAGTLEKPAGRFVGRWPRLSANQSLGATRFLSSLRDVKFRKHVLEQEEFGNRFSDARSYEQAAIAFANDTARASIVVTQVPRSVVSVQSVKLDPISGEIVVVDRLSGEIVTYYRADLREANAELALGRLGPARNLFEYLVLGRDFHNAP